MALLFSQMTPQLSNNTSFVSTQAMIVSSSLPSLLGDQVTVLCGRRLSLSEAKAVPLPGGGRSLTGLCKSTSDGSWRVHNEKKLRMSTVESDSKTRKKGLANADDNEKKKTAKNHSGEYRRVGLQENDTKVSLERKHKSKRSLCKRRKISAGSSTESSATENHPPAREIRLTTITVSPKHRAKANALPASRTLHLSRPASSYASMCSLIGSIADSASGLPMPPLSRPLTSQGRRKPCRLAPTPNVNIECRRCRQHT